MLALIFEYIYIKFKSENIILEMAYTFIDIITLKRVIDILKL
jgi:hypothetical protein